MQIALKRLGNGVSILRGACDPGAVASCNIWVTHPDVPDEAHLLEHMIAGYHKALFKRKFPAAINAVTDRDSLCFFCRAYPSSAVSFFQDWLAALDKLLTDKAHLEDHLRRETRVIAIEMEQHASAPHALVEPKMGIGFHHKTWTVCADGLHEFAARTLVGANVTALILGHIEAEQQGAIEAMLAQLPSGPATRAPQRSTNSTSVFEDRTRNCVGVLFDVRSESIMEYPGMMVATKLLTSKLSASLSSMLRHAGLAYKVDRSMVLTDGGGTHALFIRPDLSRLREVSSRVVDYFSGPLFVLSDFDLCNIMQEVTLYQALTRENLGVFASRIGKHFLNYGTLPEPDFMAAPFASIDVDQMRDFVEKMYFGKSLEVATL